jgi:hypothetical protein
MFYSRLRAYTLFAQLGRARMIVNTVLRDYHPHISRIRDLIYDIRSSICTVQTNSTERLAAVAKLCGSESVWMCHPAVPHLHRISLAKPFPRWVRAYYEQK